MHRAWVLKPASRYFKWQVRMPVYRIQRWRDSRTVRCNYPAESTKADFEARCAGWPAPAGVDAGAAQMQALMQIIGNATPQAAMEIQRQLTAGAGPFTLQGMQVTPPPAHGSRHCPSHHCVHSQLLQAPAACQCPVSNALCRAVTLGRAAAGQIKTQQARGTTVWRSLRRICRPGV